MAKALLELETEPFRLVSEYNRLLIVNSILEGQLTELQSEVARLRDENVKLQEGVVQTISVQKSVRVSFYKHGLIASGILIAGAVYLAVAYTPLFGLISLIPLSVIVPLIIKTAKYELKR